MKHRSTSHTVAIDALLIALLIASCMFTIPLGPIPFTMQTAVVMLVALLCPPRQTVLVIGVYLLMGLIGLPVLSGMTGGPGKLVGPTGGFLVGFLAGGVGASCLRIVLRERGFNTLTCDIVAVLLVILISDIIGCLWFAFVAESGLTTAFLMSTAPFIIPDCCKAAAAIAIAGAVRKGLHLQRPCAAPHVSEPAAAHRLRTHRKKTDTQGIQ